MGSLGEIAIESRSGWIKECIEVVPSPVLGESFKSGENAWCEHVSASEGADRGAEPGGAGSGDQGVVEDYSQAPVDGEETGLKRPVVSNA